MFCDELSFDVKMRLIVFIRQKTDQIALLFLLLRLFVNITLPMLTYT